MQTGEDCFRHYEMIIEGNIVLVPDADSLHSFMGGLPVFFMGELSRPLCDSTVGIVPSW